MRVHDHLRAAAHFRCDQLTSGWPAKNEEGLWTFISAEVTAEHATKHPAQEVLCALALITIGNKSHLYLGFD